MTSSITHTIGLHIENVSLPRSRLPFARAGRAISIAINRAIERTTVAGAVRAQESGDGARLARYLARGRAMHARFDRPSPTQMSVALSGTQIVSSSHVRSAWMRPDQIDEGAVLVYVHGGSFIAERSPKLTALIARIAKSARLNTLMVDYRLAPEHPCPAAADDVEAAVRDLIANGQAPDRVGIVAESAGASIALAATSRLRASGLRLGAACLLSPWTDLALTGRSAAARSIAGDSPISMESMAICAHFYLQGRSPLDPIASPVYGNLDDLPPLLIHTSKTDSLHDDACLLADRTHEAGCAVTLRVWSRGSHVFEKLFDQQSERAIADVGMFFRERLGVARRARPG
ncbi:MAG: alpha/beta hydrolase [Alphaproteobacteria bacterium]|nr:alpha/beta hydrolase [Alphaproteobacteria bacterium]